MAILLESEVQVLLRLFVRHQLLVWVGPDLGLGIKVGDPEINEEVIYPIKMISNE